MQVTGRKFIPEVGRAGFIQMIKLMFCTARTEFGYRFASLQCW